MSIRLGGNPKKRRWEDAEYGFKIAKASSKLDIGQTVVVRNEPLGSAMLLQFTRAAGAVLVRRDGLVVEPLVGAFGAALRSSEAWRYASDPAAYFASYSDPEDDDQ